MSRILKPNLNYEKMKSDICIWLVTTDHLEDTLWFREEEDFKVGMNYVAVLAAGMPVFILAFILMSNHVHFVLMGTESDARAFINEYKRRYSKYYQRKYGFAKFLKKNDFDIQLIPFDDEAPERAIAYVLMNCVAAKICTHPSQYPWGSGDVFFDGRTPRGIRVDALSDRALIRITHSSRSDLPGHWLIGEDGYVLPTSYVRVAYVENLFRNPSRMDYFLRTSSKARKRLESGPDAQPSFKDQTILVALPELCRALYGTSTFEEINDEQKKEVLRQLRYRFSSNVFQLARVVGLSYEAAARLMDSQ